MTTSIASFFKWPQSNLLNSFRGGFSSVSCFEVLSFCVKVNKEFVKLRNQLTIVLNLIFDWIWVSFFFCVILSCQVCYRYPFCLWLFVFYEPTREKYMASRLVLTASVSAPRLKCMTSLSVFTSTPFILKRFSFHSYEVFLLTLVFFHFW